MGQHRDDKARHPITNIIATSTATQDEEKDDHLANAEVSVSKM